MKKTYITPNAQVVILSTGEIAETLPFRTSLHTNEENAKIYYDYEEFDEDEYDFEKYDDNWGFD